jgi:acetyl esterase/lipase
MLNFLLILLVLIIAFLAYGLWLRRSEDLSVYDRAIDPAHHQRFSSPEGPSKAHGVAEASIAAVGPQAEGLNEQERIVFIRNFMEEMPAGREYPSTFTPVQAQGVSCQWVQAPGTDPARRVLYIHGGAFIAGSPNSHRPITSRFSEVANAAVLAVDYRLMPEHRRMDGIADCQAAYRWLLDNGPDGAAPAERVFIGGDSAGGNLSLMMAAWIRDQGLRAPDAVVALSPVLDSNYTGGSIEKNLATDTMLGPLFGKLTRIPKPLLAWLFLYQNRIGPSHPLVSPLYGDLSNLPPTLIQVSESEMLYDDAHRYVVKALEAGSPAKLQGWARLLHVWQMFYPEVPEAAEAFEQINAYLAEVESRS